MYFRSLQIQLKHQKKLSEFKIIFVGSPEDWNAVACEVIRLVCEIWKCFVEIFTLNFTPLSKAVTRTVP